MSLLRDFQGDCQSRSEFYACLLVLGIAITMTRAWVLTNLFEVLLVVLVFYDSSLRKRVLLSINDARVFLVMLFWAWIGLSMLWSHASIDERFGEFWSWRKLILVPICFALFQKESQKRLLMISIVTICSIFMIATWLGFFGLVELDRVPKHYLENHATQGVLFGGSSLFCVLLAFERPSWKNVALFSVLLVGFLANILFISTGRSGYVFLVVIAGYGAFFWAKNRFQTNVMGAGVAIAIIGIILTAFFVNETTQKEINKAFHNIDTAFESPKLTSMGIRVVMWKNSLELIKAKPLLGSGAGAFKNDYKSLVDGQNGWRSKPIDDPHQQYLHIAAEHGLIGLALFLFAVLGWLFSKIPHNPLFYVAGVAILLGTVANGFANGHFSAFVEGRFFWIVIAAFLANTQSFLPDLRGFNGYKNQAE